MYALLNSLTQSFRQSFRLAVLYSSAIFLPRVLKFLFLIENYLRTNCAAWICDPLPRSSGIDLKIGPSRVGWGSEAQPIFPKQLSLDPKVGKLVYGY
jgi:hypothetical protein